MSKYIIIALSSIVLIAGMVSSGEAVVYQPVPGNAEGGYVEVFDPAQGIEYGQARIEYSYWLDGATGYWHYAYQIFNNDYYGTPANLDDDYHFGWLKFEGSDPNVYDTINKFSVNLDPDGDGFGPPDLVILDTQGGAATAAGNPLGDAWGNSPDPGNRGVDWTVSLGSGTPLPIAPTRHEWVRDRGTWQWVFYADGETSRDDSTGQYFEIASTWAPGPTNAAITAYVDYEAAGTVMGPVIPEPASLITLLTMSGLGSLTILRRRRGHPKSK